MRQEKKLQNLVASKDSIAAKNIFQYSSAKLKALRDSFSSSNSITLEAGKGEYNEYTDTLNATLKFLQQKNENIKGYAESVKEKISTAKDKLSQLEAKFQKSKEIQKYLKDRRNYLNEQLQKFGLGKKLKKIEQTTFYYRQYVKEYGAVLKNRKKIEQKAMALLYNSSVFKKFIKENSMFAGFFRIPAAGSAYAAIPSPSLAGIQTRVNVSQMMQNNISAGGSSAVAQVKQQIQNGQAELNKLKDKIAKYGTDDGEIPSFKINTQKTKKFLKRLEYGANIQFAKSSKYFPSAGNIAFTVGYKLDDVKSFGVGLSYKIGMGTGWDKIKFTSEGLGLRSYLDWKLKKSFYISGGYEQNYNAVIKSIDQLKNYSAWTPSALIGISKKYKASKKAKGKLQLLFDAFANKQIPKTSPFIFRTGISIN